MALLEESVKEGFGGLRAEKRRRLAEIAARDLAGGISVDRATVALSDLADAAIEVTLTAVDAPHARGDRDGQARRQRTQLLLGHRRHVRHGGRAHRRRGVRRDSSRSSVPSLRRVRLTRSMPISDQKASPGALVRTLDGYIEYYRRWAHPWEYQALIKARASGGSKAVGDEFIEQARSVVWPEEVSSERIESIRKMKEKCRRARGTRRVSQEEPWTSAM